MKPACLFSIALFIVSASGVLADSSTPPTREGCTPGTDREARLDAQADAVVRAAPATADNDRPLHHRISQNTN